MVSSVFGKAERRSHLGDLVSCIPPPLPLLHKPALAEDLSSSLDPGSYMSGDSESVVWVPSVKPDGAPVTEMPKSARIFDYWN